MNPKVDAFMARAPRWRTELEMLRSIALECGLREELKWGKPCYSAPGGNVAIIQPFKARCAFMFFKGALLNDPDGLLERPGPNSHAARRIMFGSVDDIVAASGHLRAWIAAAAEAADAGTSVPARPAPEPVPAELTDAFERVTGLQAAFEALTPGRRRVYILHFTGARQAKTRIRRIEKCIARILDGRGLDD